MIGTAGSVVDPYDDGFESLKTFFEGKEAPGFIKEAAKLTQEELDRLPDHAFAVVMLAGDQRMRKYACVDKAHTAVNVMYFLEHADEMPSAAKEKVAVNLTAACRHFGLSAPPQLLKKASKKLLIKNDGANVAVAKKEKEADLVGGPIMPQSARPSRAKLASVMLDPYVEVRFVQETLVKKASFDPAVCALDNGRLPLLSYGMVKEAVAFFQHHGSELHPRTRHAMCIKVASRAEELGVPADPMIQKYGSTTFSGDGLFDAACETRRRVWADLENDVGPGLLDKLMEKKASGELGPEEFAEALSELDIVTGIDRYWDHGVCDPWLTTFGKTAAEEGWRWSQGTEYLTEDQLKKLAQSSSGHDVLKEKFGESMADGLRDNPTTVFDSLPMDTKRIIARMAAQHESGL